MESINFLKKISYLTTGSIFTAILSIVYFILITNNIGPEGYGMISIALGFINTAYFAIYTGINESTIKYTAENKNITVTSLKLQYLLSILAIIIFLSIFPLISKSYNKT